jgi:hypothetical protein
VKLSQNMDFVLRREHGQHPEVNAADSYGSYEKVHIAQASAAGFSRRPYTIALPAPLAQGARPR